MFSFEPVDHYLRPLRLHSYVRDQQFIDKYNLDKQKSNPDDYEGIRSIESEVLNIFKKAEGMNADELRAKIVV